MTNPITRLANDINTLSNQVHGFCYWINPANVLRELWNALHYWVGEGPIDAIFIAATMVGVMLIKLGARWPKKVIFWGWLGYWILRGVGV
jgi:hypothetical protein